MLSNTEVANRLKKIVPYDEIYRLSLNESVLLSNRNALLDLLQQIRPIVASDDDYYVYLCVSAIAKTAEEMIGKGRENYAEIAKNANIVCKKYDKKELVSYINLDISRVLHPNCPAHWSSKKVIVENINQISDDSVKWLIDNYLSHMVDRRVKERIQYKESLVSHLLHKTMNVNIYDDESLSSLEVFCNVLLDIYGRACENPLFDDFKTEFIKKCKLMARKVDELDYRQSVLCKNLESGILLLKKMDVETDDIEKILNNSKEKGILYTIRYGNYAYEQMFPFGTDPYRYLQHKLETTSLEEFLFELTGILEDSSLAFVSENDGPFWQDVVKHKIWVASFFYHIFCRDQTLFKDYLSIRKLHILYLKEKRIIDNLFANELLNLYNSASEALRYWDKYLIVYGACMIIVTSIEKLLCAIFAKNKKIIYDKNKKEIRRSSLRILLENADWILKTRSKCISFFLSSAYENGKHGLNYRNRLAHRYDIEMGDIDNILVGMLLFVFESVFDSVLLYSKKHV